MFGYFHVFGLLQSNLNAGWERLPTVEALIAKCLYEPEGGIIGTAEGDRLREIVNYKAGS